MKATEDLLKVLGVRDFRWTREGRQACADGGCLVCRRVLRAKRKMGGLKLKVTGGTVQHGESSLCNTCRKAQIMRGDTLERVVHCTSLDRRILFDVRECSKYEDSRLPSLYDLRQQAWVLQTDEKKKQIGFVPYRKMEKGLQRALDADMEEYFGD